MIRVHAAGDRQPRAWEPVAEAGYSPGDGFTAAMVARRIDELGIVAEGTLQMTYARGGIGFIAGCVVGGDDFVAHGASLGSRASGTPGCDQR